MHKKGESTVSKRLKIGGNIVTAVILSAGVVYCIWTYIDHSINCGGCPYHKSHPEIELLLFVPFVILATVFFFTSRVLLTVLQKNDDQKNTAATGKLQSIWNIVPMLIILAGTIFYFWSCVAHSVSCTHCNGHTLYPIILLIIPISIAILSAALFAVSRLLLFLIKKAR